MEAGPHPTLKPGDKAGRYELLLQLAQGGMGAVWVARLKLENGFEKLFAVKTLLTHLADQSVFRDMFLDEARIAANIEHPNVCQILDLGEQNDLLYLVMEWVEGESLNSLARANRARGRVPHGVLLRILADACAGLHAVHEHTDRDGRNLDIVHRDVSPHNMLVSTRGQTKIIDFGVAKARDRLTGATQSGNVKGKLRYMAPEQAAGRGIDRRADVWGVGAVLYALVSGRYPYAGESDVDILRMMIMGRDPDPLPPGMPAPIERVIRKALQVAPERRHPTAAALAEDLERAALELGVVTTSAGVAAYLEETAGPRIGKLRAAIRSAIEERDEVFSTVRRRSMPDVETTSVDFQLPMPPEIEVDVAPQTQSGTLGSSALDRKLSLPPPAPRMIPRVALAAAGVVALGGTLAALVAMRASGGASTSSRATGTAMAPMPAESVTAPTVSVAPVVPPPPTPTEETTPTPMADTRKIELDEPATPPAPPPTPPPTAAPQATSGRSHAPRTVAPTPPPTPVEAVKPAASSSPRGPATAPTTTTAKKRLDPKVESAIDTRE
ncbi:MAG: serine/threonine-protein kinase [Polyangiaceae bacterium]